MQPQLQKELRKAFRNNPDGLRAPCNPNCVRVRLMMKDTGFSSAAYGTNPACRFFLFPGRIYHEGQKKLRVFLFFLLALVFIFSAGKFIGLSVRSRQEQQAFEKLASSVETEPNTSAPDAQAMSPAQDAPRKSYVSPAPVSREKSVSSLRTSTVSPYAHLKEQNGDFFGWLSIEGTIINYPVMYTPKDPQYYLHRAFDKTGSQSGVPFLDATCFDDCGNYLIHGHNMKNGTMFASLLSYAQMDYWQAHPVIQFDTVEEMDAYEVLAAFYSKVYGQDEEGFRYYEYADLTNSEDFYAYLEQVKQSALYETNIVAEYGDQLLTLSTCSYHTEDGRFVVVARKQLAAVEKTVNAS